MEKGDDWLARSRRLVGDAALERLAACRVAVFGLGGVGGHVVEVLARSGVGALDLFDADVVSVTNLNRQLLALRSTLGMKKVEVAAARVADINPACRVTAHDLFFLPSNADEVDFSVYDYVVDCVDTVAAKMELVRRCTRLGVPVICSMGAANKLDATAFRVMDIADTRHDPLARIMRKRLKREGITHFKCVCSLELPREPEPGVGCDEESRRVPASNAFVPAAAGLVLAAEVVKELMSNEQ
ncbi:MAG: tRNA threonylcarbamoyladenosine dehydratase [Muribaculaceae bacterium]|nr:tRNA threonylcarbamoyladenosine dehydratase [Muribaculaceae bacterium]